MPPAATFLGTWRFDPVAGAVLALVAVAYAYGVVRVSRAGGRWPWRATAGLALALGAYAAVSFGFLGVWSADLRWAFTTRIALLLLVVPGVVLLGRPLDLAYAALPARAGDRLRRVVESGPARLLGNAIVAPLAACALMLVFLTPLAGTWRTSLLAENATTVAVPVFGLMFALPIAAHTGLRSEVFIAAEFLFAFLELVIDSIPGLILRLTDHVLDGVGAVAGAVPAWFPDPLRDQWWSGDFLWVIAEVSDLPILLALFVRWVRSDTRRARTADDLSETEHAALMQAHLNRRGPGSN